MSKDKKKPAKTNASRLLDRLKIPYELNEYDSSGEFHNGEEVAATLGVAPAQVFKTLVTVSPHGEHRVCVIPVAANLDLKKAARHFGDKDLHMLPLKDLTDVTGYIKGGCSPLGMKKAFPTILDQSCLSQSEIYVSAGRRGLQLRLKPSDLLRACDAETADIIEDLI
ncbi:Cys-tRNA(Pro) deacylase [Oscillospiraceae bacterium HV4-5-C5C]|nr:Cys-tRNA(Pro) deacylase [Oscillospiraceae bacterium HV4-5-C5C]